MLLSIVGFFGLRKREERKWWIKLLMLYRYVIIFYLDVFLKNLLFSWGE